MKFFVLLAFVGLAACQSFDARCPRGPSDNRPEVFGNPMDCTHFFRCFEGRALELRCPSGLFWSNAHQSCEQEHLSDCIQPISRPRPIEPNPNFLQCPAFDVPGEFVYFPHRNDCQQFYQCSAGRAVQLECPPGFLWNIQRTFCDQQQNVRCVTPRTLGENLNLTMRNCVSLLLLLAVAVSICNAQAPRPAPPTGARPAPPGAQGGAPRPAPGPNGQARPAPPGQTRPAPPSGGPGARPAPPPAGGPNRQQAPPQSGGPALPRATRAPGSVPSARPNPQQNGVAPRVPPNQPGRAPTPPSAVRPTTRGPVAPTSAPVVQAPRPPAPTPAPPGGNNGNGNPNPNPRPPNPTQAPPTTTQRATTAPAVNAPTPSPTIPSEVTDGPQFPTAPTVAPIPPIRPVQPPQPNNPSNPIGRPDRRCPMISDARTQVQLPHENDCGRYYRCDSGLAFEYTCPEGQHWNAVRDICDSPVTAGCRTGGMVNWNQQFPNWNIPSWNNQPRNPNPGYEHPIIIPMAPRT
ncbi:uncharacterized protein [Chironomus tepperi]|uniref:uncharacterized protein n=1 Tax=Chironomus tepperi TaxID=113505 RepID=UPI00391FC552